MARIKLFFGNKASAGGGVTAALTGQGLTVAQGSTVADITAPLSGQSVSIALGTVVVETGVSAALTGQSVSVAQGSVSPVVASALTGQGVPVSTGTVVADVQYGITGQGATLDQGSVSPAIAIPITGQGIQVLQGDVGIGGDIVRALTGQGISVLNGSLSLTATRQGDGTGWERFKDLKPLKKRLKSKNIPEQIIDVIEEIVAEQEIEPTIKKPVSILKKELKDKDIVYEPIYGEILKIELKLAIDIQKQFIYEQEEEELLLLMAA